MTMVDHETGLYTKEAFQRLLAEDVEQAARDGDSYAVVACLPRKLPPEGVADVVTPVARSVRGVLRKSDLATLLNDEVLVVGAPQTPEAAAQVVAHRLKSHLGLRSAHWRNITWEAGVACLPGDGASAEELLQAAIDAAVASRRVIALNGGPAPWLLITPRAVDPDASYALQRKGNERPGRDGS